MTLIIKKIFIILAFISITALLYLTWSTAGILVNKPINQRYDFCQNNGKLCVTQLLEKFNLTDKKIAVSFKSFDGTQLNGLYFPSKNGAGIIVQHGYGGHMGSVMHIVNMLHQQGFGVITMDLRAHGTSGGELVTFGRDEAKDMQFAFDYLKSRPEINNNKIGLYGWSLGGATVLLHGAMNDEVKAVVADSPFDAINYANMQEFTDTVWPFPALLKTFSSIRSEVDFDQEAPIAHLKPYKSKPIFIMIAGADAVVEAGSGERLVTKLQGIGVGDNLKIWREPTFGHVRFSFDASEKFASDVGAFFTEHLKPNK